MDGMGLVSLMVTSPLELLQGIRFDPAVRVNSGKHLNMRYPKVVWYDRASYCKFKRGDHHHRRRRRRPHQPQPRRGIGESGCSVSKSAAVN